MNEEPYEIGPLYTENCRNGWHRPCLSRYCDCKCHEMWPAHLAYNRQQTTGPIPRDQ